MAAYYGPGSTGATNPYPAPIPHAISNPPFFHTNKLLDTMTGAQNYDRMEREWLQRGMRALPEAWDVLNPGGPGVAGLGAFATPSPFLFPGDLPSQGVQMPDGSVIQGQVGSNGQITGTATPTPGGRGTEILGQVNSGLPGGGGAGGSISFGAAGSPTSGGGLDGDALLEQQRQLAFGRLDDVDELYQTRLADLTNQALERQIAGTDRPFGDERLNQMEARLAAQSAAADRGRRNRIREDFASRGLGGSGAQLDSELQSMGRASAQRGQNLTSLLIQQAMENFQARERAQAGAQSWLANQAAGIMPAILEEARMRSRFEVTGEGPTSDVGNALNAMALNQLQGPDPASNPAAFNTTLPFGPGAAGNISTPGGPPIRATGGVNSNLQGLVTVPGQGGGLQGSSQISSPQIQRQTGYQTGLATGGSFSSGQLGLGGYSPAQIAAGGGTGVGFAANAGQAQQAGQATQASLPTTQPYLGPGGAAPVAYSQPVLNTGGFTSSGGVRDPYGNLVR